ncbi:Golgi SNAP receptor complex member 1 isoform X1 [Theropithecus gelada]|uniref:Golgi SNAP receptor complex member 1 isoform X1 n=1 Tax=Theropithecus gelada TaxID=9565 RepID=UPI000DC1BB77|nr:Golgi SNAP receptor complex member 1 isoform X1 [Theropithecus gelada]
MAAGTSNYWEDLRKQARQLENELDLKLVSFSKLCTSYSHSSTRDGRRDRYSSDTTPLLNGSSQDRMFETMAIEIEQLLARLTGVNDKMAEYTNSAGVPSLNAALMHTLQRHRDILQDYTHEFHKTKANFMAIRERENLMGSVRKDIESYKSGSGVNNRRTELFLKEHDHLRKSSDRRDNKHCYGNKRKYDFTERNVEVNSQQNEHFGQSFSCCKQPDPKDQPEEAAGLAHPRGCYWDLYHPVAAVCVPLMGHLQGLLTTTTFTPWSGIRKRLREKLTVLIISLTSRMNARLTVMDSVTWSG